MSIFSWLKTPARVAKVDVDHIVPGEQPSDIELSAAHRAEGNVLLDKGELDAAAACYHQAVMLTPESVEARVNLGFTLAELQRHSEAEQQLRQAVRLAPASHDALYVLATVLRAQGDSEQAASLMQSALAVNPAFEVCRCDLVQAQFQAGDLALARDTAIEGLRLNPNSAELHHYLGNIHAGNANWGAAVESYSRSLAFQPEHVPVLQSLGDVLKAQGDVAGAIEQYRKVVLLSPANAEARLRLGSALHEHGQLDAALASYEQALALDSTLAEAHSNIGTAFQQRGDLARAIDSHRKAIALKPGFAAAHSNLGNALQEQGDIGEAVASYRQALALQPDAVAHNNLAGALLAQGRLEEAIAEFSTALGLQRDYAPAQSNLLFALNYHPDKSPGEIFAAYRDFEQYHALPLQRDTVSHSNDRGLNRRLKVGYVSPDFRHHPVRYFLEPLLANHDKSEFEIYAYAEGAVEDGVTDLYRRHADHWISTLGMSNDAIAQRIREDGIDILVDLAGHTGNNRLLVFARKPAPVSLSWLGFGYTTGLTAIDYFLTDATCAPAGCEDLLAEVPWRLATPCYVYRPGESTGTVSPLPALQRGFVTFGTLTRAVRINHRTIRVWSEILQRVPGSRLVVDSQNFKQPRMQTDLAARFAAHGVSPDRLQIGFSFPPWDVLRGLDIGLDCFPHNSGTTLFEMLYMGLPYVTLASRPSVGRIGSSILEGVGHPEWIADSEDAYVEKVVALATDLPRLAKLRGGLRAEMKASLLMDEAGFARKVEHAYHQMFASWIARLSEATLRNAESSRSLQRSAMS